jgi:hypothetical protein
MRERLIFDGALGSVFQTLTSETQAFGGFGSTLRRLISMARKRHPSHRELPYQNADLIDPEDG